MTSPNIPAKIPDASKPATQTRQPRTYEILPVWESGAMTKPDSDIVMPAESVKPGHAYRARVRMKDATGRWSHWSAPVEFTAGR